MAIPTVPGQRLRLRRPSSFSACALVRAADGGRTWPAIPWSQGHRGGPSLTACRRKRPSSQQAARLAKICSEDLVLMTVFM